jgi:regulator of replication initiation timing
MDRLTRRSSNGVAVYAAPSADAVKWKNTRYEVLQKLADYEDLEERLNKVYGDCDGLLLRVVSMLEKHPNIDMANNTLKSRLLTDEDVDKWEEYKQSEEQGRLIKLPCKVGDTAYEITGATTHGYDWKYLTYEKAYVHGTVFNLGRLYDIGKTVFLTKSEAEAKLKELRGGEK